MPVSRTEKRMASSISSGSTMTATPPRSVNLIGIAGKIEQHLAQARGVADQLRRQPLVDEGGDLDALGLRARRQQFDGFLDQWEKREGARFEIELAGFDLGKVEDFLDQ